MKLYQAIQLIEGLQPHMKKRSEVKNLQSISELLHSLSEHSLSAEELQSIEDALDRILFSTGPKPSVKELKRNRKQFMIFLREEFSLTPKGYYMSLGIGLGLAFGAAFGSAIQTITGGTLPLGVGVSIGMVIGMGFGMMKDNEAERQNRVLQTKSLG